MSHDPSHIDRLLKAYREGTISAEDRHALERMALDDPFLFDAMEGYQTEGNHSEVIGRLKEQVTPTPVISMPRINWLSIAAGIVVLVGAIFWINQQWNASTDTMSQHIETDIREIPEEVTTTPPVDETNEIPNGDISSKADDIKESTKEITEKVRQDGISHNEYDDEIIDHVAVPTPPISPSNSADIGTTTTTNQSLKSPATTESEEEAKSIQQVFTPEVTINDPESIVEAKVAIEQEPTPRVETPRRSQKSEALNQVDLQSGEVKARLDRAIIGQQKTIQGRIVDLTGEPLIGANVIAMNGNEGVSTDIDGNFSINIDSLATELEISYVGYETLNVELDSFGFYDIVLEEGDVLDEVVVTGYGSAPPLTMGPGLLWPPGEKIRAYRQRLNFKGSRSVCSGTGKIKVKFVVNPFGEVFDFEIKKDLTPECKGLIYQWIKEEGRWNNQTNQNKKVRLTLKF